MKKYYVTFVNHLGNTVTHCFENDREQAIHFASLVNGNITYGY